MEHAEEGGDLRARLFVALGVTILLVTALRNSWMVTLAIAKRE